MRLSTWIITEVTARDPQASIHFVVAYSSERARDLVTRRRRIPPEILSVVRLWEESAPVAQGRRKALDLERYLGPLEQFSPYLKDSCSFCRGTGKIVGSKPSESCGTCGGSGLKTARRV